MKIQSKKIVLCAGVRTPFGHIARSLAQVYPEELFRQTLEALLRKASLSKEAVDGVICGWVGQGFHAPNIARVTALKAGLPERVQAFTVQNNCISSIESVAAAARCILSGEGEVYLAGGTESMSLLPFTLQGSRASKELRSLEALKNRWGEIPKSQEVAVVDSLEQGLTDPVQTINMAATAEVCAQIYEISREKQDVYALESFSRCLAAWKEGFYRSHVFPVTRNGATLLEKDEYPFLREELVSKPEKFAKAPLSFDTSSYPIQNFYHDFERHMPGKNYQAGKTKGTVTLFNSCARSDGASAVLLATEEKARKLKLPVLAEIAAWGFYGNNPAHMGISPALAAPVALERAGISFEELDSIELHEPFAATVLSIFKVGEERFGNRWEEKWKQGRLNPHGGSIAMGHPLGATGTRLVLNLLYALQKKPSAQWGLLAACAGGGMGGAMVLKKV
ncbi:MAG: thiolase family protein [Elusimicrobia bacterium]|nr:thiolase family protein [Elusimicrobiota bacterium]